MKHKTTELTNNTYYFCVLIGGTKNECQLHIIFKTHFTHSFCHNIFFIYLQSLNF